MAFFLIFLDFFLILIGVLTDDDEGEVAAESEVSSELDPSEVTGAGLAGFVPTPRILIQTQAHTLQQI